MSYLAAYFATTKPCSILQLGKLLIQIMASSFIRRVDISNFREQSRCFCSYARMMRRPFVFVDTEFPGTIYRPTTKSYRSLSPDERYALLKANVDDLHPIHVGITLCNADDVTPGNAAIAAFRRCPFTWQFDLRDFDIDRDPHVKDSIALLESSGIDLDRNRRIGEPSAWIAHMLVDSDLVGSFSRATWVAFQGGYDFAILLKALMQLIVPPWLSMTAMLPPTLEDLLMLMRNLFGISIYDIKCMLRSCDGLHGGLESVAKQLLVGHDMEGMIHHQAGSDSFLTCHVFFKLWELYFCDSDADDHHQPPLPCDGHLFGFEY